MGTCFGVVVHSRLGGFKQQNTTEMDARIWEPLVGTWYMGE